LASGDSDPTIDPFSDDTVFNDKLQLVQVVKEGLNYAAFEKLCEIMEFSNDELAGLLRISTKTLQRIRANKKTLKPALTEKMLTLAEVFSMGFELFRDKEKFHIWLRTPSFVLGGSSPLELLKDSYGTEMVIGELVRTDAGIFV